MVWEAFRERFELRDAKPDASLKKIADILNAEGFTTKEDKPFHPLGYEVRKYLESISAYIKRSWKAVHIAMNNWLVEYIH